MPGSLTHKWPWGLVLLVILLFQMYLPIVSDEAYFIAWGATPAFGYYDHPPMPGWISWGLRQLGTFVGLETHGVLHRLFALALGVGSLWLLARRVRAFGFSTRTGPALIALATIPGYLLLFNLYLNDTILTVMVLLFLLASEAAYRASSRVWMWVFLAGLAFAAVLLTKYNGAVVYLGMILGLLTWREGRRFLFGRLVFISLVALVPFALHLWWNFNNCSVNLAFNFGFRNAHATGYGPVWLLLTLIIMAGPAGFLALFALIKPRLTGTGPGFFNRVFLGSLVVMLIIAIWRREFGVNWGTPLGFMAVLALAETGRDRLMVAVRVPGTVLSAITLLPVAGLIIGMQLNLVNPQAIVGKDRAFSVRLNLDLNDKSLVSAIRPMVGERVFASMEYGIGAAFDNAGFKDTTVLSRLVFGRNQDLLTDFRALDGRDFVLLSNGAQPELALAAEVFDSFEIHTVVTNRQSYDIILGQGFIYEAYRKGWILPVITKFYDQSPIAARACYMDRYR